MSPEKELVMLRKQKTASAIVLGSASVITVLAMVFGFTQKIEAQRHKDILQHCEREGQQLKQALEERRKTEEQYKKIIESLEGGKGKK